MLRRLGSILIILTLVFLPLFFAPKAVAADWQVGDPIKTMDQLDSAMSQGGMDKYLQEFCKKRQGNQMNLETWYSGKCTDDSFSGEGVGFSDIVLLDLAEKIVGKVEPGKTFSTTLQGVFDLLNKQQSATPQQQQLALNNARQMLFANQNNGLIGQTGKLISTLFQNQPASTGSYFAYVTRNLQNHKIISPAFAASQGIGFDTFSPFLTIWIAFRNLAYLGLVVFFIIYGFMMMFRVNLGQKTVISVQLAIPKLIVTLLIITFSYAIVGLIYDLMWVVISFIFSYLESQQLIFMWPLLHISPAILASGNSILGIVGSFSINSITAGPAAIFGVLNLIFGGILGALTGIGSMFLGGWIIILAVWIAVLISYGKLFFKLITAFISVVISLVTAPLVLLGNAFPGSNAIGTWFRSIVANLSVFPVTMLLLTFSYILMVQPLLGLCSSTLGIPAEKIATNVLIPFLTKLGIQGLSYNDGCQILFGVKNLVAAGDSGIYGVPLVSSALGVNAQGLLALLGVGLLLMASKYVDIVRDALKVPPFKYGTDISKALEGGMRGADQIAKKYFPGSRGAAISDTTLKTNEFLKKT